MQYDYVFDWAVQPDYTRKAEAEEPKLAEEIEEQVGLEEVNDGIGKDKSVEVAADVKAVAVV